VSALRRGREWLDIRLSHLVQALLMLKTCTGTNALLMTPQIRLGTVWR